MVSPSLPPTIMVSLDVDVESTYTAPMKAIQITFDERLLARLDADAEVKRDGRSAVLRRAVAQYLAKKRRAAIADAYRRGYGKHPADADFVAWADEATWPEE
jgi:predicted transcriptional regulator